MRSATAGTGSRQRSAAPTPRCSPETTPTPISTTASSASPAPRPRATEATHQARLPVPLSEKSFSGCRGQTPEIRKKTKRAVLTRLSRRARGGPASSTKLLVPYVTSSHTRPRFCNNIFNCSDPPGIAGQRRCVMKRIKPVVAVAALAAVIFGERWLRSKMHQVIV
jgi:hypothetical protein